MGTPAWRQISPRRRHPAGLELGEAGECRAPAAMGIWKEEKLQRELSGCCALRYMSPVVVGSLNEQLHNPELDTSSPDVPTRRRRLHLRAATARMKAAALGQDLDMHDAGEAQTHSARPLDPGPGALLLKPHPWPSNEPALEPSPLPLKSHPSLGTPLCSLTPPPSAPLLLPIPPRVPHVVPLATLPPLILPHIN